VCSFTAPEPSGLFTEMTDVSETAPTTKRYGQKRESLIAAASALFNQRGVIGTTLTEVAASVGLIKNSVTYYFRKKEDLAVACFMRAIEAFEVIVKQSSTSPDITARVREFIRLEVQLQGDILAGAHPTLVMFHEIRALPEPLLGEVFRAYTTMFRKVRNLLDTQATAGWPRDHLNARAHLLLSLVHAIKPIIDRYEPEDYPGVANRLADIILHGVGAPQSQWSSVGRETEWLQQMPERDLNSQFLRAATELINEQGYAGASVNRIAERLNFTKGGFYYYNDNKGDLILQCFERSAATVRKAVNLTESHGGSGWEAMCSIVRGLIRFQLSEDGPLLRSAANSALPDPLRGARVNAEFGRVRERIAGVVVRGLVDGSVRPLDPFLAAHLLLSGITAAAELRRWVKSADEANAADLFARPMMTGLLSPT
jgi:AcrR family transcriptional regulator